MSRVESFCKQHALDFKPPKFYGEPLNCLKLWRAVTRLGGYDRVTSAKLWRQVGESFNPPKTCTTVSWTFRIFYEKALLETKNIKGKLASFNFPILSFLILSLLRPRSLVIKHLEWVEHVGTPQLVLCKAGILIGVMIMAWLFIQ